MWAGVCPDLGGACNCADFAVGITIYFVTDHGIWTQNGAKPIHGNSTADGRTGTFTSGIVSIWREWRIALYFTGWKHAGENLADVLKRRDSNPPRYIG